jgi:hypothetical protein
MPPSWVAVKWHGLRLRLGKLGVRGQTLLPLSAKSVEIEAARLTKAFYT